MAVHEMFVEKTFVVNIPADMMFVDEMLVDDVSVDKLSMWHLRGDVGRQVACK